MFLFLKGRTLSWPLLSWVHMKKKSNPWCSCLAGLWDCFVSVMQWPRFSPVVSWYNQCEGGQVQVIVLVSCCVFSPQHGKKICWEVLQLFSPAHHPTLQGFSPFYLNSPVGLTVFQLLKSLLLLCITVPPRFAKYPLLIFILFWGLLPRSS